jgi:hypothetical protein
MTSNHLRDPAIMLETLKLAYLHALDEMHQTWGAPKTDRCLTEKQQRELGRRLAEYWTLPSNTLPSNRA